MICSGAGEKNIQEVAEWVLSVRGIPDSLLLVGRNRFLAKREVCFWLVSG